MPTKTKALTRARVAALCMEVTRARLRALAMSGSETSADGRLWLTIGLENALSHLVEDLAGFDAVHLLHETLGRDIGAQEVAAFKADLAAKQQAYLDRAAAAAPVIRAAA